MGHEELGALDGAHLPLGIDAGPGDDAVDVWMEEQSLVPGVQDSGKSVDGGPQPSGSGEFFSQRLGTGTK